MTFYNFKVSFLFFFLFLCWLIYSLCVCTCMSQDDYWKQRTTNRVLFSPSPICVPGIKLNSTILEAKTHIHWAMVPTHTLLSGLPLTSIPLVISQGWILSICTKINASFPTKWLLCNFEDVWRKLCDMMCWSNGKFLPNLGQRKICTGTILEWT